MVGKDEVQKAISRAVDNGISAVAQRAFEHCEDGWKPRPECLIYGYTPSEGIICSILLTFYFETYGTPKSIIIPEEFDTGESCANYIWQGAWYTYTFACLSRKDVEPVWMLNDYQQEH